MDLDQFFAAIRAQREKQESEMTGEMFLIAGLGNPGREYRESRHNFGFMVLDRLAARLNAEFNKEQQKARAFIIRKPVMHSDKNQVTIP